MTRTKNVIHVVNIPKKRPILLFFSVIFTIIAFFILYLNFVVSPVIIKTCSAKLKVLANKSMDYAITEAMSSFVTYDDIIKISRDSEGNVFSMQANAVKVNNISRMVSQIALAHLIDLGKEPLQISLGAFTGIDALSGVGVPVKFNINPYGDITCKFISKFVDAGINQTEHKIYIDVSAVVRVVFPIRSIEISSSADVLICEGIIIGKIPDTYLRSNSLTEMLNLVP